MKNNGAGWKEGAKSQTKNIQNGGNDMDKGVEALGDAEGD